LLIPKPVAEPRWYRVCKSPEAARELGADVDSDAFERVMKEMARTKPPDKK